MIKALGARRVIPQPAESIVGNGGIHYVFPVSGSPASVEFGLEPTAPGIYNVPLSAASAQPLHLRIFVLP